MAVPTISAVEPVVGLPSGRQRLTITGTNFRLPPPPPPGFVGGAAQKTVDVLFDSEPAEAIAVLDATEIIAVVPEYTGNPNTIPKLVGITVKNLDDFGVPIGGEEFTLASAFTYKRQSLTVESDLAHLGRHLMRVLRRNLIDNVAMSASPDYSDDPLSQMTAIGKLPVVVLTGPVISENTFYRESTVETNDLGNEEFTLVASPFTVDLTWVILVLGRSKVEAQNLVNMAIRFFNRRPLFRFPCSPTDPTIAETDWFLDDWNDSDALGDQVFGFESSIKVEAIRLGDAYGLASEGAVVSEVFGAKTVDADTGFLELDETEKIP